jgi:hypothetical protein
LRGTALGRTVLRAFVVTPASQPAGKENAAGDRAEQQAEPEHGRILSTVFYPILLSGGRSIPCGAAGAGCANRERRRLILVNSWITRRSFMEF